MCALALLSAEHLVLAITGGGGAQRRRLFLQLAVGRGAVYLSLPQQTSEEEDPEADELFVPNGCRGGRLSAGRHIAAHADASLQWVYCRYAGFLKICFPEPQRAPKAIG